MRGRGPVAALVALTLALVACSVSAGPAVAAPQDPCARFALRADAIVPGPRLASCLASRMARSRPTAVHVLVTAHGSRAVAGASESDFVAAIRSIPRWRVLGRDAEVVSGVFRFAPWRLEPMTTRTGTSSQAVLRLTDDDLPVAFVSTLIAGRLRLVYVRTWAGWSRSFASSCAACAGTGTPPTHG